MKYIKEFPDLYNFAIERLEKLNWSERHENGYFLVKETWGTCFFRVATNRKNFAIRKHLNAFDKIERTYSQIPVDALQDVFFISVNYHIDAPPLLLESESFIGVVGLHEPVQHVSNKNYYTQTLLVYSHREPTIIKTDSKETWGAGVYFKPNGELYKLLPSFFKYNPHYFTPYY